MVNCWFGPGGLDSWNPRKWKGLGFLGAPLESQTTGPQTNNQPLPEDLGPKKNYWLTGIVSAKELASWPESSRVHYGVNFQLSAVG